MTRVIKARALTDATPKVSYLGRLVSHPGAPTPERLESAYSLTKNVVLIFRREYDGHRYWVETAVPKDADITIHDEP